jgi:hypothetical protein
MINRITNRQSDLQWTAKAVFVAPADGDYAAIRIPAKSLVKKVWLNITKAAAAVELNETTSTLTVGHSGGGVTEDLDGFIDAALGVNTAVGMIASSQDSQPASEGIYFEKGALITVSVAIGDSASQGDFELYVDYVQIT